LEEDAEAERGLEAARRRVYESATHFERWQQLKRQFTESVERSQGRLQGLAAERERALEQAEAAEQEHSSVATQLEESAQHQQESSARLSELDAALNEQRRESAERQSALIALHRELTATEHRLKSLIELDERRAYFSEAVQTVMQRSQKPEDRESQIEDGGARIEEDDPQSNSTHRVDRTPHSC
jgi:non-ribosomal peptide synthetase component F